MSDALVPLHDRWLRDPITKQSKDILDAHENLLVANIADQSMSNVTDQHLRQLAVQLKTVRTIKQLLYDTKLFVSKLSTE